MKQVALTALLLLSYSAITMQGQLQVPPEERALRQFLLSTYPDLAGRALQIRSDGTVSAKDVSVLEVLPSHEPEARLEPLLSAQVEFSPRHAIKRFAGAGPMLRAEENADLGRAVRDARARGRDVAGELAQRELPFGPTRRFEVLDKLERLNLADAIGTVRVLSAVPDTQVTDGRYGFLWKIEVEATRELDKPRHYTIEVEPFGGRLVSFTER